MKVTLTCNNVGGILLRPSRSGKDARTAVRELMALPPSKELELPPTAGGPAKKLMEKLGLDKA